MARADYHGDAHGMRRSARQVSVPYFLPGAPVIFSEVLDTLRAAQNGWQADIPDDWQQGRTAYGGLQTALAVGALRRLVPADLPLRVAQTTFMAPVPAGAVRLETRVLRTGKSAVHAECRIGDGEQALCTVLAIFGRGRDSALRIAPSQPEPQETPDAQRELPYRAGLTPAFTQHFAMRWTGGGMLFSGAASNATRIHVRHREAQPLAEAHVIALADTVPSPGLSMLHKPAMASSLTWTLEFVDHHFDFPHEAFWRMDTEVTAAGDGYLAQSALLWNPQGRLCALSRQSVVVFG